MRHRYRKRSPEFSNVRVQVEVPNDTRKKPESRSTNPPQTPLLLAWTTFYCATYGLSDLRATEGRPLKADRRELAAETRIAADQQPTRKPTQPTPQVQCALHLALLICSRCQISTVSTHPAIVKDEHSRKRWTSHWTCSCPSTWAQPTQAWPG
jgi:hypothetical protein